MRFFIVFEDFPGMYYEELSLYSLVRVSVIRFFYFLEPFCGGVAISIYFFVSTFSLF